METTAMVPLLIVEAGRDRYRRCTSRLPKAGYVAQDATGGRSADPQLLAAQVVGYRPGLGSCIEREE
jgi:hypothetical protein